MSDNLKNDIFKAISDSKETSNSVTKEPANVPVFKDPQMLQHSLDKSLQNKIDSRGKK